MGQKNLVENLSYTTLKMRIFDLLAENWSLFSYSVDEMSKRYHLGKFPITK